MKLTETRLSPNRFVPNRSSTSAAIIKAGSASQPPSPGGLIQARSSPASAPAPPATAITVITYSRSRASRPSRRGAAAGAPAGRRCPSRSPCVAFPGTISAPHPARRRPRFGFFLLIRTIHFRGGDPPFGNPATPPAFRRQGPVALRPSVARGLPFSRGRKFRAWLALPPCPVGPSAPSGRRRQNAPLDPGGLPDIRLRTPLPLPKTNDPRLL